MRVGIGFDAHRFTRGRPLILGGIEIPYSSGLEGWSDADVLTHAIADSLLGAMSNGDLGTHFPPGDPRFKDVPSVDLLAHIIHMLNKRGYKIVNVDATLILEEPKIESHRDRMIETISKVLGINKDQISIKATTTERLGFSGRGEGVAAQAIVLIQ